MFPTLPLILSSNSPKAMSSIVCWNSTNFVSSAFHHISRLLFRSTNVFLAFCLNPLFLFFYLFHSPFIMPFSVIFSLIFQFLLCPRINWSYYNYFCFCVTHKPYSFKNRIWNSTIKEKDNNKSEVWKFWWEFLFLTLARKKKLLLIQITCWREQNSNKIRTKQVSTQLCTGGTTE